MGLGLVWLLGGVGIEVMLTFMSSLTVHVRMPVYSEEGHGPTVFWG